MDQDLKREACCMMELLYKKTLKLIEGELFPVDWFSNIDYEKKIVVLQEAIEKKILIIETISYQEIIEGVRR